MKIGHKLMITAALAVSACATGPLEKDWIGAKDAQSFRTAAAACSQTSYNIEANFVACMAGRGWVKARRTGD
ncbi:MAG: hypothetical protein ACO33A_07950 [Hyphomonas sp.]